MKKKHPSFSMPSTITNHVENSALSDQEAIKQLAAIVIGSDDAIIGINLNGVITSWNRGAELIFGYSPAEVIGQSISILLPSECVLEEQQIALLIH